ncbi:MAG: glutathione S-transferase N-terminal domain-containing protein [Proteobacteria bacterium]|nr:glutathione S-transferase N-terminal domain-containing protein [Pseudomonadota bacterium]MDA1059416.1 glutathione S-transferase N-terminal domain-containing protein [Pseudomonadota bacterium]
MKLFYTPIPSLIHKVQVVAIEAGVYEQIERIPTNPFDRDPAHIAANPLSKVPTLVRDDGSPLFGGPAVYEYLDSLHSGPKMFPPSGEARWTALRHLALGDGLFDTAVLRVVERGRPKELVSIDSLANHTATMIRCLDTLENEAATFAGFTVGLISIACALIYLDRQLALGVLDFDWRGDRSHLAGWFKVFTDRRSFRFHDDDFRKAWNDGDKSSRTGFPD